MSDPVGPILYLAGKLRFRSSSLFLLNLIRGIRDAGETTRLLCSGVSIRGEAARLEIDYEDWNRAPGGWRAALLAGAFRRMLDEWGVRLVHVHGQDINRLQRGLLHHCKRPVVYTPGSFQFNPAIVRRIQLSASHVIASDQGLREDCVNEAKVPKEKVVVVQQGINLGLAPVSLPRLGEQRPVVGTMGPLILRNGLEEFLKAARKLVDDGARARFIIAGDGPDERSLRTLCSDLHLNSCVTFVTRVTSLQTILECIDIFVRPSVMGGLGFVMLGAMAAGKAVVASDVGGAYSLLKEGVCGKLVAKGDSDALAAGVAELLADPARTQQYGRNAREFVRENYRMQDTVERTLAVYRDARDAYKRLAESPRP